jgi:hypothetical protein
MKLSNWGQLGGYRELIGDMLTWTAARLDDLEASEAAAYVTDAQAPRVLIATDVALFEIDLDEQDRWRLVTHLWREVRGFRLHFGSISYRTDSRRVLVKIDAPAFEEDQRHENRLEALTAFGKACLQEIARVR